MPKSVVVSAGDCVASIAYCHGFFPPTVWEHPDNADLKGRRVDGNVLVPGDRLMIPDRVEKTESCGTGQLHTFRRRGVPEMLKLEFRRRGKPRVGVPYVLEVDGEEVAQGETDDAGAVEHYIHPLAHSGRLILAGREEFALAFGRLEPVDTEAGARARLHNLGLLPDERVDEQAFGRALSRFQLAKKLEATGVLDGPTCDALLEAHGR